MPLIVMAFAGTVGTAADGLIQPSSLMKVMASLFGNRVRVMPTATQHRVHGERNERQSLEEPGDHRVNILASGSVGLFIVPHSFNRVKWKHFLTDSPCILTANS
tara:strand:+ start:2920 stop:3231 length:312 start_codon:yes stop_codon:yes gene_type:complete